MKMINLALAEIKPAYYPGEEKLVSLDMLKLYQGEDVFWQNLEDLDPDRWLDEGELTKLPEIPRYETEAETRDQPEDQGRQELPSEPTQDIPMIVACSCMLVVSLSSYLQSNDIISLLERGYREHPVYK